MATATQLKKDRHMVSWTREEDDLLREQIAVHGSDNWEIIAAKFKDKTGRQCRRRWLTNLNTECKKGGWSHEEDKLLCEAHKIFGNRWTEIAKLVSGRTDNAVKNRFSMLCKKRAKHHIISKENSDSYMQQRNKKIMVELLANKQLRPDGSDCMEDYSSSERLAGEAQLRPPLALLAHNFNNLSCFPEKCHIDSIIKPEACYRITNCDVRTTFLRKDDPKLTFMLQQAELLSFLAVKAYSENKKDAWKELQNYIICGRDGAILCISSGIALLLDNFEVAFKDLQCVDGEFQLARSNANRKDSRTSSESSIGCRGHSHQSSSSVELFCQGGAMPSSASLELEQSNGKLHVSSSSEFDSPFKTIPALHSFTEEIPSPEFSSSERKFLLSALGASSSSSSSRPVSNAKQTPFCSIDSHNLNLKQPYSCKKILLDIL